MIKIRERASERDDHRGKGKQRIMGRHKVRMHASKGNNTCREKEREREREREREHARRVLTRLSQITDS